MRIIRQCSHEIYGLIPFVGIIGQLYTPYPNFHYGGELTYDIAKRRKLRLSSLRLFVTMPARASFDLVITKTKEVFTYVQKYI